MPMTKGGVITGSTDITRKTGLKGMRVRAETNANARPSKVVSTPTMIASASEFQATPQLRPPCRQARPQIEESVIEAAKMPIARCPALS